VRELPNCVAVQNHPSARCRWESQQCTVIEPPYTHTHRCASRVFSVRPRRDASPRSTSVISFVLNTTTNRRAAQPGPLPPRRNTERGERWLLAGIGPSRLYVGEAVKFSTIGEPPVEHGTLRKRSEAGCCSVVVAPSARHVPGWSRNHLCAPCPQHYSS